MACDVPTLVANSQCMQCEIPQGLTGYVALALMCRILNGESMACDIDQLMEEAKCLQCTVPQGMLGYLQLAVLCNISALTGGTITGGPIISDTEGIYIVTDDAANEFAYSLWFQKRGRTGDITGAILSGAEIGNIEWQGWDGAAYQDAASIVVKATENFSPTNLGTHIELRTTNNGAAVGAIRLQVGQGLIDALNNTVYAVNGTQVVSARNTGWTTFTGTANKNAGALDTGTVTTAQLAQVVKSLFDALVTHGLIGT